MAESNPNSRLEAFCDGVFAIALTLLIIDLKIPSTAKTDTTHDLWLAIVHLAPSLFAFILSFSVILITWVNHHGSLRLINKSTPEFIYANGFLLLTVVFLPFPTSLVGEYILTDHASPAVIIFDSTLALQALGWILITRTALRYQLAKDEKSTRSVRKNGKFGYYAVATYSAFAILAIWFPLIIFIITALIWIFWLVWGIHLKSE
jgi:uncharacterized membrane protein